MKKRRPLNKSSNYTKVFVDSGTINNVFLDLKKVFNLVVNTKPSGFRRIVKGNLILSLIRMGIGKFYVVGFAVSCQLPHSFK